MTKARTKGEKRRQRGRPRTLERDAEDRPVRQSPARRDDVTRTVLEARLRLSGVDPVLIERTMGVAARDAVFKAVAAHARLPWAGCVAGRRIAAEPDVVELWQVVSLIREARLRYLGAIVAPSEHARSVQIGATKGRGTAPENGAASHDAVRRWEDVEAALRGTGFPDYLDGVLIHDIDARGPSIPVLLRKVRDALAQGQVTARTKSL